MDPVKTIALSLNDIVFENRNKQYGAYQIRQAYENHLSRATMIGVTMFALALAAFWFAFRQDMVDNSDTTDGILEITTIDTDIFVPPPPPKVEPPKVQPTPPVTKTEPSVPETQTTPDVATAKFTDMVASNKPTEDPTRVADLEGKAIGTANKEGEKAKEGDVSKTIEKTGPPAVEVVDNTIHDFADKMPEYEGGMKAMTKFIQNNMRVPSVVGDKELAGTVYVGFVVNSKGEVTDVKILKGIHPACDNEAMRVVSKMKNWTPGQQAGRNVSVRYTIPIKFDYQRM